jgi:hypothetical protein
MCRRRPTLPPSCPGSTMGAGALNFRVRNGNGCFHAAIAAGKLCAANAAKSAFDSECKGEATGCFSLCRKAGLAVSSRMSAERDQASRAISTGKLNASPRLHLQPINVVVFHGSLGLSPGRSYLGRGFALRCFQRLSLPDMATRRCHWRDNRITRGPSTSVLSY